MNLLDPNRSVVDRIIQRLDDIGRAESPYEYGLPVYSDELVPRMREAVETLLGAGKGVIWVYIVLLNDRYGGTGIGAVTHDRDQAIQKAREVPRNIGKPLIVAYADGKKRETIWLTETNAVESHIFPID